MCISLIAKCLQKEVQHQNVNLYVQKGTQKQQGINVIKEGYLIVQRVTTILYFCAKWQPNFSRGLSKGAVHICNARNCLPNTKQCIFIHEKCEQMDEISKRGCCSQFMHFAGLSDTLSWQCFLILGTCCSWCPLRVVIKKWVNHVWVQSSQAFPYLTWSLIILVGLHRMQTFHVWCQHR